MRILAADMWPGIALKDPNKRYQDFLSIARPRFTSFIENLILYDDILVPTDDYISLTLLIGVLGEDSVVRLIDEGALRFLRFKGALAYVGNGGGLINFAITGPNGVQQGAWGDMDAAAEWALSGLNIKLDIKRLKRRVLEATREIDVRPIMPLIRDQTYTNIQNSLELRRTFAIRNVELSHLAGIEPNGVRIYGGVGAEIREDPGDEIDTVLAIARANLEKYAFQDMKCDDARTATPIGHVLAAANQPGFPVLREFSDVPDIGELVLQKALSVKEVLALRRTRHWPAFICWFHAHCKDDPKAATKEYIKLLKDVPLVERAPAKIIRFLATTGVGLLASPLVGGAVGAADTFGIGNVHGVDAKYFIERLEQITAKQGRGTT